MATDVIERVRYYQRQFLGADDFQTEQGYGRDMRRRHNLAAHTWGIVAGLRLIETEQLGDPTARDVYVQAGLAVDGYGREIIALAPAKLDASLFAFSKTNGYLDVWIGFKDETALQPAFGYAQCQTDANGTARRWIESFEVVIAPGTAAQPNTVVVDGKPVGAYDPSANPTPPKETADPLFVPSDFSVPFQELPTDEDGDPRWLIKLGSVRWDGSKLIASDRLDEERRYAGAVAATIYAPSNALTLRPRTEPSGYDPDKQDFALVDGRLQVNGRVLAKKDVFVHGGKVSFMTSGGPALNSDEDATPLWMKRRADAQNTDLRAHIGEDDTAQAKARFSVGPKEKNVLAVSASDKVDIPTGVLGFGAQTRQMIHLWQKKYGIGVQSGTWYARTDAEFRWWKGGEHKDDPSDPANGTLLLRLSDEGRVFFGAQTKQMLNLWNTNYGIGVQGWTLYLRADADFCWFRGGQHSDQRSNPGVGGALAMKLNQNSDLTVSGKIGSGVTAPGAQLHVRGDRIRLESADGLRRVDLRADGSALDVESAGAPLYVNNGAAAQNTFINPMSGNVGVGTANPGAKLDVVGSFRVGGGTAITKMLSGTAAIGSSASNEKQITVNFANAFNAVPRVLVTVRGQNFADVFAVTTRSISNSSVTIRVKRVDTASGGWAQNLQVDWMAME